MIVSNFRCTDIEEKDKQGRVTTRGVAWNEYWADSVGALALLSQGVMAWGVALAVPGVALLVFYIVWQLALAGFAIIAVAWLLKQGAQRMPMTNRALCFRADGTVHCPLGLTKSGRKPFTLRGSVRDIASIEVRQITSQGLESFKYGVRLVMRDGRLVTVAATLDEDEAHMLATRLNLALTALRDDLAAARALAA